MRNPWSFVLVFAALALGFAVSLVGLSGAAAEEERPAPEGPTTVAQAAEAWETHKSLKHISPWSALTWRSVGPVRQGGRVVDIEVDPADAAHYYVAYASGGVFETTNNGQTFTPIFDDQPTLIMGDMALDPQDPKRIWVGTGENNSSRSSYGGAGVFLSEDGGASWSARGLAASDRIGRIAVDPTNSQRVFVAALGKLYTPGGERGVYRTTDGGTSWKQVLPGDAWTGAIDVAFEPGNPQVVYAATWERRRRPFDFQEAGAGSALWQSKDGGDTWRKVEGVVPQGKHVGRIGIAVCPAAPKTVTICLDNQAPLPEEQRELGAALSAKRLRAMDVAEFLSHDPKTIDAFVRGLGFDVDFDGEGLRQRLAEGTLTLDALMEGMGDANSRLFDVDIRGLEVYRTDDAGATWRRTHREPLTGVVHTYGYYFGLIEVDPTNPDRVFTAGVPMLRSTDGGATFESIAPRSVHVDHHAIWINPARPQHMRIGNDGGVDESHDGGATWRSVDNQAVGQFYTLALDNQKPYRIYGGLQDNGTLVGPSTARPGEDRWEFIGGGDGMHVQIDPRDGTLYYGYQFGHTMRKGPDGKVHTVRPTHAMGEEPLRYNWSTPVVLSPHNADIVYYGTNRLFRSMDKGDTWTAISPDLTTNLSRGDVPFACITSIAEDPRKFGRIYVGTDDGHVHVTHDGGVTWKRIDASLPRDRWVSRVVVSEHIEARIYVTMTGYRDDDAAPYLFVSDDRGVTWHDIGKGLPREAVNVVREDPHAHTLLYVGTDRGVYVSQDTGAFWHALGAGLPPVPVHDLQVHRRDRELVAATHGRSVYVLDVAPLEWAANLSASAPVLRTELMPPASLTGSGSLRRKPGRWRKARTPKTHPVYVWSAAPGKATLDVLLPSTKSHEEALLRRIPVVLVKGLNRIDYDRQIDADKALGAEQARLAADEYDPKARGAKAQAPWSEAKRLGQPIGLLPGKVLLRLTSEGVTHEQTLRVK